MLKKAKIIIVVGPTASGKTALAVHLSKQFAGEIVSADSRQVYLGMDLGTGKEGEPATLDLPGLGSVPARLIEGIPQYLIDVISPRDTYTVADFQAQAMPLIENILSRAKTPFIVGGTNLYINALVHGYTLPPAGPDELRIRARLEAEPAEQLLTKLKSLDPVSYARIDHRNLRRVIRALSVTLASGQPFSSQQKKSAFPYDVLYLGLNLPRETLYQNIDNRVDARLKLGMVDEVRNLLASGVPAEKLINFGLEYRFITQYLTGVLIDYDDMVQQLKYATHAYARRQLTWLNHQMPVTWAADRNQAEKTVATFLSPT